MQTNNTPADRLIILRVAGSNIKRSDLLGQNEKFKINKRSGHDQSRTFLFAKKECIALTEEKKKRVYCDKYNSAPDLVPVSVPAHQLI